MLVRVRVSVVSMRLVIASLSLTSVFSITIQRRAVSTPLNERLSTTVIKMLHQVLKDSRKASESGVETYAKVICLFDETRQRRHHSDVHQHEHDYKKVS